jgi:hypothetical protein
MFVYANTLDKTPLEIQFMYLGQREIYSILKTCCIICVLISWKKLLISQFYLFMFQKNTNLFHKPCANLNITVVIWRLRSGSYEQQTINICNVTTLAHCRYKVAVLYQTNTNKCTHILLNHHFINNISNPNMFRPLTGHHNWYTVAAVGQQNE